MEEYQYRRNTQLPLRETLLGSDSFSIDLDAPDRKNTIFILYSNLMRTLQPILLCLALVFLSSPASFGQSWDPLNPPLNLFNGTIYSSVADNAGNILAAGDFKDSSNKRFVAKWDGVSWSKLGSGSAALNANAAILTLCKAPGGDIYAAGNFLNDSSYQYVARWNGTVWSELGKGDSSLKANGLISSITADRAGNVYAAGLFANSAGKYYVAKWDGNQWKELGAGPNALQANSAIFSVTSDSAGNIYAGGYFTNSTGKIYIAKWNGSAWSELGSGSNGLNANDFINCLATDSQGNVYAGGSFRNADSKYYVAKWNGSGWNELGMGTNRLNANNGIKTLLVKSANEIYAGGFFTNIIGDNYVAKWDGALWTDLNTNYGKAVGKAEINCIVVDTGNQIYAGGKFTNVSGNNFIAKWNGTDWIEPGSKGDPFYTSQPMYNLVADSAGQAYVSGYFMDGGGNYYLQHWDGNGWKKLAPPYASNMRLTGKIVIDRVGNIFSAGNFLNGAASYPCILKWNGQAWSILEDSPNGLRASSISALAIDKYGNLYVAGLFSDAASSLYSLAKWDGSRWFKYPGSFADYISTLSVSGNGIAYAFGGFSAGGRYHVSSYKLNEMQGWREVKSAGGIGLSVPGANVFTSMAADNNNNLYVNGYLNSANGQRYIAKWNGVNWAEFGLTNNLGYNILIDKEDNVYSSGPLTSSADGVVKKWNGTAWTGLGAPFATSAIRPYGEILATDVNGFIYSDATLNLPGSSSYIVRFKPAPILPPVIASFNPTSGSTGTPVKITGQHFNGSSFVSFGGTAAASFTVNNDSTITATVGNGASGRVLVRNAAGTDSLQTFTYTCDSVFTTVPLISNTGDSVLSSTAANYYQWYFNNNTIPGATLNSISITRTGFYRVTTSDNNLCWASSLDYPVIIARNPLSDSLKMNVYPNPSQGLFTVQVKLPQTTTVVAYVAIYDMNGLQMLQTNRLIFFGNEIKIPVLVNTRGTYLVKVFVNGDSKQQSIIIL